MDSDNTASIEMPHYQCHKRVWALKISAIEVHKDKSATIAPADEAFAQFRTDPGWAERFKGDERDPGFYVLYADNYASWSPSNVFDAAYTRLPKQSAEVVSGAGRELTSHKVNGLNDATSITVLDEPGAGGASHEYLIQIAAVEPAHHTAITISFQNGPILEAGFNGIGNEALLAILEDRLVGFQSGPYACDANDQALRHIQAAMSALHGRTKERVDRGVEGTHKK